MLTPYNVIRKWLCYGEFCVDCEKIFEKLAYRVIANPVNTVNTKNDNALK